MKQNKSFLKLIVTYLGISGTANALSILLMSQLYSLLRPEQNQKLITACLEDVSPFTMGISFSIAFITGFLYLYPLRNYDPRIRNGDEKPKRRLLNAPLLLSELGFIGWVINLMGFFAGMAINQIPPQTGYIFNMISTSVLTGLLVYIFTYFALENVNRRIFIPAFLQGKSPLGIKGVRSISTRLRFSIFFSAVGLFPLLLMSNILYTQLPSDKEIILITTFGIIVVSLVLTRIFANSFVNPLKKMESAVKKIKSEDYEQKVPMISTDEIGVLSEGINEMSQSLIEKQKIHQAFGMLVDPKIRDHLLNNEINPGGETRKAVVLFCDIRGFTALSEKLNPHEMVSMLNEFFEVMNRIIEKHGGLVNKFLGDAMLALFNVPATTQNPEADALHAAIEMITALSAFNRNRENPIEVGIGIHSGQVLAGNIGSSNRMEYTVIGDPVNLASRLEGVTKMLSGKICISEEALLGSGISTLHSRSIGPVQVKGRNEAINLYEILNGLDSAEITRIKSLHSCFTKGQIHFRQGDFQNAKKCFSLLYKTHPGDPLIQRFLQLSMFYTRQPPSDWNGAITMKSK